MTLSLAEMETCCYSLLCGQRALWYHISLLRIGVQVYLGAVSFKLRSPTKQCSSASNNQYGIPPHKTSKCYVLCGLLKYRHFSLNGKKLGKS